MNEDSLKVKLGKIITTANIASLVKDTLLKVGDSVLAPISPDKLDEKIVKSINKYGVVKNDL